MIQEFKTQQGLISTPRGYSVIWVVVCFCGFLRKVELGGSFHFHSLVLITVLFSLHFHESSLLCFFRLCFLSNDLSHSSHFVVLLVETFSSINNCPFQPGHTLPSVTVSLVNLSQLVGKKNNETRTNLNKWTFKNLLPPPHPLLTG